MRKQYFKLEEIGNGLLLTHRFQSNNEVEEAYRWNELEGMFRKMFKILSIDRKAKITLEE